MADVHDLMCEACIYDPKGGLGGRENRSKLAQ
jgi:hypothetical protein